jgi:hypothetical protein
MTIFILRWFRHRKPAPKPEPAHVKKLAKAAVWNIAATTGKGRRLG